MPSKENCVQGRNRLGYGTSASTFGTDLNAILARDNYKGMHDSAQNVCSTKMFIQFCVCRSASPPTQHHSPVSSRHHSSSSQSGSSIQRRSPSPRHKRTPSPSYKRTTSPPVGRSSSPYPHRASPSPQQKQASSRRRSPVRERSRHDHERISQSHDRHHERRDGMNNHKDSPHLMEPFCSRKPHINQSWHKRDSCAINLILFLKTKQNTGNINVVY